MKYDVPHGAGEAARRFEAMIARLVNPSDPTPKQTPETPNVTSQAYFLPQPAMSGGRVSYDDCKRTSEPSPMIPGMKKGDMADFKSADAGFTYYYDNLKGSFIKQLEYQADGIRLDGRGRRLFYCIDGQRDVDFLTQNYARAYKDVFFQICHR